MINNSEFLIGEVPEYYVYGYFDKDDVPFYIGMGKGKRITNHLRKSVRVKYKQGTLFYNKLEKMIESKEFFSYRKIKENLTIKEAITIEVFLIKAIGRRDLKKGPLCNLTNGGEGHKGYVKSKELKERISKWGKGKKLSEEHKRILREVNLGKKHSEETKRKISAVQKGIPKPKKPESIPNYIKAARKRANDPEYIKKCKIRQRKRFGIKVEQLDLYNNLIKVWDNQIDAAEYVKGRGDRIIEVCKGKRSKHKEYKWRYYDK